MERRIRHLISLIGPNDLALFGEGSIDTLPLL